MLAVAALAACLHQFTAFFVPRAGAARPLAAVHHTTSRPRGQVAAAARGGAEEGEEAEDDDYEFSPAELIGELKPGQEFEGVVTSIQSFGAFVDIGTEREGLVPISKLQDGRTENVEDVVQVGQGVTVWVSEKNGDRLTLSMSKNKIGSGGPRAAQADLSLFEGVDSSEWLTGTVVTIANFGAFVSVKPPGGEAAAQGLVHVSQVKDGFVDNVADELSVGDEVQVRVLSVDQGRNRMALSMKPEGAGGGAGGPGKGDLSAFQDIADTEWLPGTVKGLANFGAFVEVEPPNGGAPAQGLVHISQIKEGFIEDPAEELEVDQEVRVRVISVDPMQGKMSLSMREIA